MNIEFFYWLKFLAANIPYIKLKFLVDFHTINIFRRFPFIEKFLISKVSPPISLNRIWAL